MTARDYAAGVQAGDLVAGPYVRAACARFTADLGRTDIAYDDRAEEVVARVFGAIRLTTKTGIIAFVLQPWQRFVLGNLIGWKWVEGEYAGERRFRRAYVETGRGTGKTPLAAGVGLFHMLEGLRQEAEVYVSALTMEQANFCFRTMVALVNETPDLAELLRVVGASNPNSIIPYSVGGQSRIRRIAYKARGQGAAGSKVKCAITDEYHEHTHGKLLEMLESGMKGQQNPLSLVITNAGADTTGPCFQLHEHAIKVSEQEAEDDGLFAYVCALDEGDDYRVESVWVKTLPGYPVLPERSFVDDMLRVAKQGPAKLASVRRMLFCEWITSTDDFLDREAWDAVRGPMAAVHTGEGGDAPRSYMAIDLGEKVDLTAMAICTDFGDHLELLTKVFMPGGAVDQMEHTDGTPYRALAADGHLIVTPGEVIDFDHVVDAVLQYRGAFNLVGMTFDKWRFHEIALRIRKRGVVYGRHWGDDFILVEHPQGFGLNQSNHQEKDLRSAKPRLSMPTSLDALEKVIREKEIVVEWNPLLWGAAEGVQLAMDGSGNRRAMKNKSTARIDVFLASAMAVGFAMAARMGGPEPPDYTRTLESLEELGWQ